MGVEQTTSRQSMGAIAPTPVMRSPDVGGEVVKQIVGIGSQLIQQGIKDAGASRVGKASMEITESLESSLNLSRVERNKKFTSMLSDGLKGGTIQYKDIPAIKQLVARTETTKKTMNDGTIVTIGPDGAIIPQSQPTVEGQAANRMLQNGTKIELALPQATKVFQDMIGSKMSNPMDNAPIIEAATNLTNFFETIDNQLLIASNNETADSYNMELQDRAATFKMLLAKVQNEVASVAVAQKLGAGDGGINTNAPRLVMKAIYDDLRVQMTPKRLRSMGLAPDTIEKMASDSRTIMTEFGTSATKMGAVDAVDRMRVRGSVMQALDQLRSQEKFLARLSPETKELVFNAKFMGEVFEAQALAQKSGAPPAVVKNVGEVLLQELAVEPMIKINSNSLKITKGSNEPRVLENQIQIINIASEFVTMFATGKYNDDLDLIIETGESVLAKIDDGTLPKATQHERNLRKRLDTFKRIRKGVR